MKRIREILFAHHRNDGFTLIEVVVAMMVFSIITVGVAYSMVSVLAATRDARGREVAANLAAQEIDLARSIENVFDLHDRTKNQTVNGTVYTVKIFTDWVTATGVAADCGVGGGTLQYKRINVSVMWPGKMGATPVRADTVLAPASKINDPTLGTILVRVKNASGTGSANVAVTVTPVTGTGAETITDLILPTDAEGCTYALKVKPGTYTVKISRADSVTEKQETAPESQMAVVAAGATASAGFAFDYVGKITAKYATNYTASAPRIPVDLHTSMVSTYGIYLNQATTSTATRTFSLHPFTGGYQVLAGKYANASDATMACASINPMNWPDAVNPAGSPISVVPPTIVTTGPSGTATVDVPMGVVAVKNSGASTVTLRALSTAPDPESGDPGCDINQTLKFADLAAGASAVIALPYGTWKIQLGASVVGVGALSVPPSALGTTLRSDGTILLDPRRVVAP